MKEIQLTRGRVALVDDDMYEYLNQWKWHAFKHDKTYYATRNIIIENTNKKILMHRVIMNTPNDMEVDHINHDGLYNIKSNLRNCTRTQNAANRNPFGRSKYSGVSFNDKYIRAAIYSNKKHYYLGHFKTEEEAARAYDKKARELHGEFANLNFNS